MSISILRMAPVPMFCSKGISLLLLTIIIVVGVPTSSDASLTSYNQDRKLHFPTNKQGEFASSLTSYDIITPIKVNGLGGFISHNLGHSHQPKSGGGRSKRNSEVVVHYDINLDGKSHRVRLYPNQVFLAPNAVIERRNKFGDPRDKVGNTTSHVMLVDKTASRCHFVGSIINHNTSKVALSACNGLQGFLKTDVDEYLIEPIKGHIRSAEEPHPHLLYRKSSLSTKYDKKEGSCSSHNYAKSLDERAQWEQARSVSNPVTKRRKRSVSLERNVEVMVVTDKQMIDYYSNEDLNTYILTVMNMVSSIYHDASIGNAVNIIVVRIMLLETPEYEDELSISHDADKTLISFCKWQQMVNPLSEHHPHHHDVAVLLTRYNICSQSSDHCSTLGLAEIAGMCQPHRSCNVNEDTGLQIAYTIAHEIGHNFGMNHDGPVNGCGTTFGQHVMSPHLATDSIPITWSNCSRNEITDFLDREWGLCLEDEPQEVEYNFPKLPPGAMYDAAHQCRLNFGAGATHCEGMEIECASLWCRIKNKCVTRLEPSAEGTQCGKHKWCYHGNCVTMGERPAVIDGNWGPWSAWSNCSRSCGAGVAAASRHCNNPPPANGGRYCTGERKKYRICNTDECPGHDLSFRATQCSKFDDIPYKGQNYTWEPVTLENNPCQLHCKPDNEFYSVELKHSVIDGTPCKPGTRNMCIHGVCKRVSCDWTIQGSAQEDRCGICHGNGTQCVTTKGNFNVTRDIGYVPIVTFPVGARNLRVEELGDAANYLAIRDQETEMFHLNGNWIIQWSGEYSIVDMMMYYKRENEKETLFIPGPLKRKLTLMLLFQTINPGIIWEYTLPHENATYTPVFSWHHPDWTICSQTCGGGVQISKVQCHEKEAGLVEEKYCNDTRPADRKQECNKHACPAKWWSGPWQPCSVTCGDNGTRRRTVICVRSYGPSEQMALMDSMCEMDVKPHEVEECPDLSPCQVDNLFWKVEPWIESCRDDPCEFETRIVKCVSSTGFCDPKKRPQNIRQCGDITCGQWKVAEWEKCSTSCGEGVQIRTVKCVGGSTCTRAQEPPSVKECNLIPCHSEAFETIPEWHHIQPTFSLKQKSIISSKDADNDPLKNAPVNYPSNPSSKNNNTSIENLNIPHTTSIVPQYSGSISESGINASDSRLNDSFIEKDQRITVKSYIPTVKKESVMLPEDSKISIVNVSFIEYAAIPEEYYDELDVETTAIKFTTASSIPHKKDNDTKMDTVENQTTTFNPQVNLENPTPDTKITAAVSEVETDNAKQIPALVEIDSTKDLQKTNKNINDEENIFVTDESINKNNIEVSTKLHILENENNTTQLEEPQSNGTTDKDQDFIEQEYDYYNDDDYEYYDYEHSANETKVERPTGIVHDNINVEDVQVIEMIKRKNPKRNKSRFKKIKIHTGIKAMKVLKKFTKKANRKKYQDNWISANRDKKSPMSPQYQWTVGLWSKCSEPCGGGSKLRAVECHNYVSDSIVPPWECHALPPPDMQYCNMFKCLNWTVGDFGECSEDCGLGIKTRNVTCRKEGRCHPKHLVSLHENCTKQPCVKWVEGPWSMCTKSCGGGYRIRYVKCVDIKTQEVSTDCIDEKPPHKRDCNSSKCQNRQSQQSHCKDHLDKKLCRRLVHMCGTNFFRVKCCRTCHTRNRG